MRLFLQRLMASATSQEVLKFWPRALRTSTMDVTKPTESTTVASQPPSVGVPFILLIVVGHFFARLSFSNEEKVRDVFPAEPWLAPEEALVDSGFLVSRVQEVNSLSRGQAVSAIAEYLRFLQLLSERPRMELVASEAVDAVWHEHLLDTANYAEDCQRLFGMHLHHRRARSTEDFAEIPAGYSRTKQVYMKRFGRAPPSEYWGDTTTSASMCGGSGEAEQRDPYFEELEIETTTGRSVSTATEVTSTPTPVLTTTSASGNTTSIITSTGSKISLSSTETGSNTSASNIETSMSPVPSSTATDSNGNSMTTSTTTSASETDSTSTNAGPEKGRPESTSYANQIVVGANVLVTLGSTLVM